MSETGSSDALSAKQTVTLGLVLFLLLALITLAVIWFIKQKKKRVKKDVMIMEIDSENLNDESRNAALKAVYQSNDTEQEKKHNKSDELLLYEE